MKLQIVYCGANGDRQIYWPADTLLKVLRQKLARRRSCGRTLGWQGGVSAGTMEKEPHATIESARWLEVMNEQFDHLIESHARATVLYAVPGLPAAVATTQRCAGMHIRTDQTYKPSGQLCE
jgi:hypothetical protein